MSQNINVAERRTSVDQVFDHLYNEIASMRLLPGTKISEAEIARLFNVSRQPVRDAFSRLENIDLLLIRPQKATEVKGFSSKAITTARFVRASIEAEVLRRAAEKCTSASEKRIEEALAEQKVAVEQNETERFHALDYLFHELLCEVGEVGFVTDVIASNKAQVDRLCVLGMANDDRPGQLLDDHCLIAEMVCSHNVEGAVRAGMEHLSRLDATIEAIEKEHADYFYD